MDIKILGTGCYSCLELELLVMRTLEELGLTQVRMEKVDDVRTIRRWMSEDLIPGLVINGVLVSAGRLPAPTELRAWLQEAAYPTIPQQEVAS
ncbi:MAG: thioredoxin family protein [Chloroflexota bacterium]